LLLLPISRLKKELSTPYRSKNPEVSLSYDLLFRGLELASGSQRVNDYEQLISIMRERKLDPKNFEMYLQAFKYGIPPEGGFSFGLERLTMKILELPNVREASLFPRIWKGSMKGFLIPNKILNRSIFSCSSIVSLRVGGANFYYFTC